jgi:Uma2 family endonuclease
MVTTSATIVYPESDGLPMANNTIQFEWIVYIKKGLDWLYANDPQVFVAGDLFWYPVEGSNNKCQAPDVMVAFGRPKGDRRSYLQWQEGGIPPQVVFEVISPSNTVMEMTQKFQFYERYGVEEYYLYDPDPDHPSLGEFVRQGQLLEAIEPMENWVSPRLGIRFSLSQDGKLQLYRPDGQPFETYEQIAERAEQERLRAETAEQRAQQFQEQVARQHDEIERLKTQLKAMGVSPEDGQEIL